MDEEEPQNLEEWVHNRELEVQNPEEEVHNREEGVQEFESGPHNPVMKLIFKVLRLVFRALKGLPWPHCLTRV
jgi:hypothetical protein